MHAKPEEKGDDDDKIKFRKKKKEILSTSVLYTACKRITMKVDQDVDTVPWNSTIGSYKEEKKAMRVSLY